MDLSMLMYVDFDFMIVSKNNTNFKANQTEPKIFVFRPTNSSRILHNETSIISRLGDSKTR